MVLRIQITSAAAGVSDPLGMVDYSRSKVRSLGIDLNRLNARAANPGMLARDQFSVGPATLAKRHRSSAAVELASRLCRNACPL